MPEFNTHIVDGHKFHTVNNSIEDLLHTETNTDLRWCSEIPNYNNIFGTDYETGLFLAKNLIIDLFKLIAKDLTIGFNQFNFPIDKRMHVGAWMMSVITKDVDFDIVRGNKINCIELSHLHKVKDKECIFKPSISLYRIIDENAKKKIYYLTKLRNSYE